MFTTAVVEGLETGEADGNQDGRVGLDELYEYAWDNVGGSHWSCPASGVHRFTGLGLRRAVDLLMLASAGGLVLPR